MIIYNFVILNLFNKYYKIKILRFNVHGVLASIASAKVDQLNPITSPTLLEINGITLIKKWYNPVASWYTIYGITKKNKCYTI